MGQGPDPVLLEMKKRLLTKSWSVLKTSKISGYGGHDELNPEEEDAKEELKSVMEELFMGSKDGEFGSAIKLIVGQVLAKRLPIEHVTIMGNALYDVAKGHEDQRLLWALSGLKKKSCLIFRMALSGDEFAYFKDGQTQYYTLSPVPARIREEKQITFAVSRKNTVKIQEAYNYLIEESGKTDNQWMVQKWQIERDVFVYLIKLSVPKLLEQKQEA